MRIVAGGTAALPVDTLTLAERFFVALVLAGVVVGLAVATMSGVNQRTRDGRTVFDVLEGPGR